MNVAFDSLTGFMLIFVRLTSMFSFNPVFSRRSFPLQARLGLVLIMTVLLSSVVNTTQLAGVTVFNLVGMILWEIFLGFCCGFVFQIFYYMLLFVGDIMDVQFGLSMAKVFDPGTSIQMSASGNFLNLLFMLYLFATDSHLVIIHLFVVSFEALPLGTIAFTTDIARFIVTLFSSVFMMGIKLLLPFAIAEFTLEVSMGVLMKLIPQIHVFVINIQLKLLAGILLLFTFAGPVAAFIDHYTRVMLESINKLFAVMQI